MRPFFLSLLLLPFVSCQSTVPLERYEREVKDLYEKNRKLQQEISSYQIKDTTQSNKILILESRLESLEKIFSKKEESSKDPFWEIKNSIAKNDKTENFSTSNKNDSKVISNESKIIANPISEYSNDRIDIEEDEEPIVLTNSMIEKRVEKTYEDKSTKIDKSVATTSIKKKYKKNSLSNTLKNRYDEALSLHKGKKYSESIEAFENLIYDYKKTPTSLSDNFYYWIGENYLALNDIPLARRYFLMVIESYPKENKVPDSIYKLGTILEREGKNSEALDRYKEVIKNYPNTEAFQLSSERLKLLSE
ncbi:tetratricopeptide repeat protein [bacterium]|nr:tetratricopeptide repeat protein [bacterium]